MGLAAAAMGRAAGLRNRHVVDALSDGEPEDEPEGEEGEWRAGSELSSPNPHSIFGDADSNDEGSDGDEGDALSDEAEEEDDDDWSHLEVSGDALAEGFPSREALVGSDVCLMHAAYPGVALTTEGAIGWRGEVTEYSGHGQLVKVFGSWFPLNDDQLIRPVEPQEEPVAGVAEGSGDEGGAVDGCAAARSGGCARGRGRGRGRGGSRGRGQADGGAALLAKPPVPGVTELSRVAGPWLQGSTCIAIEVHVTGSAKAGAAAKRIVSISAQLALVDGAKAGNTSTHFHSYVSTDFANAGDAPSLMAEHGAVFVAEWMKAKDGFGAVGRRFIAWLRSVAPAKPKAVVLASWGGLDRSAAFAVLCAELRRHKLELPWTAPISLLDVERELRLTLRSPSCESLLSAATAVITSSPSRCAAALAAAGVANPRGSKRVSAEDASIAALRGQSPRLHGVRLLAGVLGDPGGLQTKRSAKVAAPLDLIWSWAGECRRADDSAAFTAACARLPARPAPLPLPLSPLGRRASHVGRAAAHG